jgi:hypothetical protein
MQVTLAEVGALAPVPLGSGRTRRQLRLQQPVLVFEDYLGASTRMHVDDDRCEKIYAYTCLTGIRDYEDDGVLCGVQVDGQAVVVEDLAS